MKPETKIPGRPLQEFNSTEMRILYSLIDEYGKNRKKELMRELKSLLRYDRMIMKTRLFAAIKRVL